MHLWKNLNAIRWLCVKNVSYFLVFSIPLPSFILFLFPAKYNFSILFKIRSFQFLSYTFFTINPLKVSDRVQINLLNIFNSWEINYFYCCSIENRTEYFLIMLNFKIGSRISKDKFIVTSSKSIWSFSLEKILKRRIRINS